jgi:hypothetical protein
MFDIAISQITIEILNQIAKKESFESVLKN